MHNHENDAIYCGYWLIYHYDNIVIISGNRVTNYLLINLFNNNAFMYWNFFSFFDCRLTQEGINDFSKLSQLRNAEIAELCTSCSIEDFQQLKSLMKSAQSLTADSLDTSGWSGWSWFLFVIKLGKLFNTCLYGTMWKEWTSHLHDCMLFVDL